MSSESDLQLEFDSPEDETGKSASSSRKEKIEAEKERLVATLAEGRRDRLTERVAWIMSRFPETRDSDITLQLRYWDLFEPELAAQLEGNAQVLYDLTRLTSLSRARAKIQNSFRLFQASPEIRLRRGQLDEEAKERFATDSPPSPTLTVYADESGKTNDRLIVGSVWFLDPRDTLAAWNRVMAWRRQTGFEGEFHFAELTPRTLDRYLQFVDLFFQSFPLVSFKSISVSRAGLRHLDIAFEELLHELLRRGIEHEHRSGRAELPRRLLLQKDLEEEGRDRVVLARLESRLAQASLIQFDGQLEVRELVAIDSESQPLLQLADLYASSLNRVQARASSSTSNPKDVLADHLLAKIDALSGDSIHEVLSGTEAGDLHVHLRL